MKSLNLRPYLISPHLIKFEDFHPSHGITLLIQETYDRLLQFIPRGATLKLKVKKNEGQSSVQAIIEQPEETVFIGEGHNLLEASEHLLRRIEVDLPQPGLQSTDENLESPIPTPVPGDSSSSQSLSLVS